MSQHGVSGVAVLHDPTSQEVIVEFTSTHSPDAKRVLLNIEDLQDRMRLGSIPDEILLSIAQLYNTELQQRGFKLSKILREIK